MTTAYITHARYNEHDLPNHPEHAGRIEAVWNLLSQTGLATQMKPIKPEMATDAQILSVHTEDYLGLFKEIQQYKMAVRFDADTYAVPGTHEVARLSAGGVLRAVEAVLGGEADNALAAVRPPGHHAIPTTAMGFCLLGNIAMAARHAQQAYDIKRVLIVDYDVHHGNGTQDIFYQDDSVLFISTHQYPFYPGTGPLNDVGRGKGRGYTVNIPLPGGHGDENYARIFKDIVWPLARRFDPQLILVSAGFDAHWVDPLASMRLSLQGYNHISRELIRMAETLCNGKIVFVMEGGYDLGALSHGIANIAYALLGDDTVSDPFGTTKKREPEVASLIAQIRSLHQIED